MKNQRRMPYPFSPGDAVSLHHDTDQGEGEGADQEEGEEEDREDREDREEEDEDAGILCHEADGEEDRWEIHTPRLEADGEEDGLCHRAKECTELLRGGYIN